MNEQEQSIRYRLGVPEDVERLLVFGETSHWDPNWLHTSEEYYDLRIRHVLDRAIAELEAEPRRVFSLESLFFLQRYWERRPEQRRRLRALLNDGRMRLTGSGITTPDTVLPSTEAIIRDYLYGQQWLREQGILVEPKLAYLPDDFGHSPALPSILAALGYDKVAITRIDGGYFVGCDYRPASAYPLPGSSAEALLRQHRSVDFIWRGPDGAEALCHWNAFTYFQGDMLACVGVIRWMGTIFGLPWRTERHVARRIKCYVDQLAPLSKTPYLFCPIGCDFNDPIPGLVELLDRYNRRRYAETGTWAVAAGLETYLELVDSHREMLPTLELDPNPYWMGFYASRPEAKLKSNRITRKLVLAEKLSAREDEATWRFAVQQRADLRAAWDLAVLSNHHDFVTGTSPDRIWLEEQAPALELAERLVDGVLAQKRMPGPARRGPQRGAGPRWGLSKGRLEIEGEHYRVVLREDAGGSLVSLFDDRGRQWLAGPANELLSYRDSGGLWRMGHEYAGGVFDLRVRSSERPATITVAERGALLEVRVDSQLEGKPLVRWLWFRRDSPLLRMRVSGCAARRRTVTCRFTMALQPRDLVMNVPGGVVRRPLKKLYDPTFWPARSFVHVRDGGHGHGLAVFLGGPAAIGANAEGVVEWMALRNAPRERAFYVLPVLAHPASGSSPGECVFDYAVCLTPSGDYRDNALPSRVRTALRAAMYDPLAPDLDRVANSMILTDNDRVLVSAIKLADHGEGTIVRLRSFVDRVVVRLFCPSRRINTATLCDARERDLRRLPVEQGAVIVDLCRAIATVRLGFANTPSQAVP